MAASSGLSLALAAEALGPRLLSPQHLRHGSQGSDARGTLSDHEKRKIFFCNCVQVLCERLKLRQRIAATAMCWFRLFYLRQTFEAHDPVLMAATCVWAASKKENQVSVHPSRIKDQLEWLELHFPYCAADMVRAEATLMVLLNGRLDACYPHRAFSLYLAMAASEGVDVPETLTHLGWCSLNDAFRTDVVLMYSPHVIALACIRLACDLSKIELPPLRPFLDEAPVGKVFDELVRMYEGCRQIKAAAFPALASAWPAKRQAQGRSALHPAKQRRINTAASEEMVPGAANAKAAASRGGYNVQEQQSLGMEREFVLRRRPYIPE